MSKGHKCGNCQKPYTCARRNCEVDDYALCGDCFSHEQQAVRQRGRPKKNE